jgi:hypothetical protein
VSHDVKVMAGVDVAHQLFDEPVHASRLESILPRRNHYLDAGSTASSLSSLRLAWVITPKRQTSPLSEASFI